MEKNACSSIYDSYRGILLQRHSVGDLCGCVWCPARAPKLLTASQRRRATAAVALLTGLIVGIARKKRRRRGRRESGCARGEGEREQAFARICTPGDSARPKEQSREIRTQALRNSCAASRRHVAWLPRCSAALGRGQSSVILVRLASRSFFKKRLSLRSQPRPRRSKERRKPRGGVM